MFGSMTLLVVWLSGQGLAATGPSTGDTGGPGDTGLSVDQDGDGYTPEQGDCDDADPQESPGLAEICFDELDNDCDGLSDNTCDDSARLASLQGGGGCTGGSGVAGTTSLVLLPLLLAARRRSGSR
jgi:hypothetical protein